MTFPDKQKPASLAIYGMLSLGSNPSVYPARVQPELSPYAHVGHCQWHCHFEGCLWT